MCQNVLYLLLLLVISFEFTRGYGHHNHRVTYLKSGKVIRNEKASNTISVYCYQGEEKAIIAFFRSVNILISTNPPGHQPIFYFGSNPEEVVAEYETLSQRWLAPILPWQKGSSFSLNPFNHSCLGVQSEEAVDVQLDFRRISYFRVIAFIFGILLFFWSPHLATNPAFFYSTGVITGVLASLLLLVYFAYKISPVKKVGGIFGVVTLLGGFSLVVYFMNAVWSNLSEVVVTYQQYVIAYVVFSGVVSFIICYRIGPLENQKSVNLMQWTLQVFGLLLIFASSHYQEAALAVIIIILVVHNFPSKYVSMAKAAWLRRFPPQVKLLSEDEYHEEGVRETKKALDELRTYANSPDCSAWKMVSRLKTPLSARDTSRRKDDQSKKYVEFFSEPRQRKREPASGLDLTDYVILYPRSKLRFAEFVEGSSHLTDREMLEFDNEAEPPAENTDSDESFSADD